MSDNKNYYYLKLKDNYFDRDNIKVLESLENGHVYSLIILKLYIKSLKYDGHLKMTEKIPYSLDKVNILAKVLGHDPDHVKEAIRKAVELDLISLVSTNELWMTDMQEMIGKTSTEAIRKAKYREKLKIEKFEDERLKINQIDENYNNKRYNGNYFKVLERDDSICALCFSPYNIIVHHIDGYDENKKENNKMDKLISLCKKCHGKVHANTITKKQILSALNRTMSRKSLNSVTPEKEIEIELKKEKEEEEDDDKYSYSCSYFNIVKDKFDEYNSVYNDIDVMHEFMKMKLWLDNNPNKHKKDYKRFVGNWLSRANTDIRSKNNVKQEDEWYYVGEKDTRGWFKCMNSKQEIKYFEREADYA